MIRRMNVGSVFPLRGCRTVVSAAAISLFVCGGVGAQVSADLPDSGGLRISGFGTVGAVHADAPSGWGYRRDVLQGANSGGTRYDLDSRLGVQANYVLTSELELVGQVVAKKRSPNALQSDPIEWAFLAYRPTPDWTIRLGRMNLDQYMMSDYRQVGFAYQYATPPVEVYGTVPWSHNGIDITRVWNDTRALWKLKGYAGRTYGGDLSIGRKADVSPFFGITASREEAGFLIRASLTSATIKKSNQNLTPLLDALARTAQLPVPTVAGEAQTLRDRLDLTGARVTYSNLGASYDRGDWVFGAEFTRAAGHPLLNYSAGYVSVGRRVGKFTIFSGFGRIRSPERALESPTWDVALTPLFGPDAANQIQAVGSGAVMASNLAIVNQQTTSLGARWDLHPRAALKLQWDHTKIERNGGRLWSNPTSDPARADIFTVLLDFVF